MILLIAPPLAESAALAMSVLSARSMIRIRQSVFTVVTSLQGFRLICIYILAGNEQIGDNARRHIA